MRFYWPMLMIVPITIGTFYPALIVASVLTGFNTGLAFIVTYALSAMSLQIICDRTYWWMRWK